MNGADYAILAVIAISAGVSLLRGFLREAISLLGWILALWVALSFNGELGALLAGYIKVPSVRLAAAFAILFVVTLLLTALVNFLMGQLVEKTGLTGTDRMLGIVFGVCRGAVIVAVLVLLAGLTALPSESWWRESMLLRQFQVFAVEVRNLLPADLARYFAF